MEMGEELYSCNSGGGECSLLTSCRDVPGPASAVLAGAQHTQTDATDLYRRSKAVRTHTHTHRHTHKDH